MNKQLRCCNCNKVIAEEISIQAGVVKITCKCGTVNEVKAEQKKPFGEKLNYELKGHYVNVNIPYNEPSPDGDILKPGCFDKAIKGECGGPETIRLPLGFNCGGDVIDTNGHKLDKK